MNVGVSVVICCHNSARRLPETLRHLATQQISAAIPWEVIVVDNASTDNTAQVAERAWPPSTLTSMRVVSEPLPGLSKARIRGIGETQYSIISFIDDDNWVSPSWIQMVHDFFEQHPEAGAVGGCGAPAFENTQVPSWFEPLNRSYAAGPQYASSGDITDLPTSLLWGAGFSMRAQIFADLRARGFQFMSTGRLGNQLMAGEDVELCHAIRAIGWRLYYFSSLRYQHFIPLGRLTWPYLRDLHRGAGRGSVYVNIVRTAWDKQISPIERSWIFQTLRILRSIARIALRDPKVFFTASEGNLHRLQLDSALAQVGLLLQIRSDYEKLYDKTKLVFRKDRNESLPLNPT